MSHRTHWILAAVASLLFTACGGGGGGDDDPPPGPYAANAGLHRLLATGGSWSNLRGTAGGQPFTIAITFSPAPAGAFPVTGSFVSQAIQTVSITAAGVTSSGAMTIYYAPLAGSDAFIGLQADGMCSLATSNTALPDAAQIGAGGSMFDLSDLDGCAPTSLPLSTTTNTWSLEADAGMALLCWNIAARDLGGTPAGTESICIEIAADGTLGTGARFKLDAGGLAITARNY
jgi:hypothetical protein